MEERAEPIYAARRCSVCHTPVVCGTTEVVGGNGQTKIPKVPHSKICPGHCVRPFVECQYLAGHPEEKERRRQERTSQTQKRKEENENTRQQKQAAKAEQKRAREEEVTKKAEQVAQKKAARAPANVPFHSFLKERGFAPE